MMVGAMLCSTAYLLTDYHKQVCRDEFPITTARQPLLPDRDAITTNAWSEAYSLSLRSSLEGGEEERILWPRGVCAYSACRAVYHL